MSIVKAKAELEERIAERTKVVNQTGAGYEDETGTGADDQTGTNVEENVVAEGNEGALQEVVESTELQEQPAGTPHLTSSSPSASKVRRAA